MITARGGTESGISTLAANSHRQYDAPLSAMYVLAIDAESASTAAARPTPPGIVLPRPQKIGVACAGYAVA
jgi:hypothetical protein